MLRFIIGLLVIIFVTTNKHIFHNNSFDRVCVIKFHDPTNLNKPAMKHRITGENSIPALAIHNETTFYNLPQQTSQEFPSNPPLHIPNNSPCWIRIPRRYKSSLHCAKRFPFPHNFLRHENFKDARRGIENERL